MSVLTDIQQMQREGRTEEEIMILLKQKGVSPREVSEAIAQSKIRNAVMGDASAEAPAMQDPAQMQAPPIQPAAEAYSQYAPQQSQEVYPQEQYPQYPAQQPQESYPAEYQQPQQYAPQMSSDTISEISEQVVTEKLSPLRKQIEKIIDLKTTVDAQLSSVDERLKRIEKIIDRLQLSVLQKVGDYVNNVEDIKKEIIETQKSFKALLPSENRSSRAKEKPSAE